MISKLYVFIFISLGFFQFSNADELCVKNGKDLAQLKDSFPKFFQDKQEIRFARSESPVAFISFKVTEDKISGEAKYKIPIFGIKQEKGYATKLCYDKANHAVKIELDNGKDFTVKVINDNPPEATVTIKGYEMTRRPAEYDKAMAILNGNKPASSAPASNNNGGAQ